MTALLLLLRLVEVLGYAGIVLGLYLLIRTSPKGPRP